MILTQSRMLIFASLEYMRACVVRNRNRQSSSTLFKHILRNHWANQGQCHMELLWDEATKVYSDGLVS